MLAVHQFDQLFQAGQLPLRVGRERLHGAVHYFGVADDELQRAARGLHGNDDGKFLPESGAAIGPQLDFDVDGLARAHFVGFDPGVVNRGGAALGQRGDAQMNPGDMWNFVRVRVSLGENALYVGGDGKSAGNGNIGRREKIFQRNSGVTFDSDLAIQLQRGTFAVGGVADDSVVGGERDEHRRELWALDDFKMKLFLRVAGYESHVYGNHRRAVAQTTGDGGDAILRERSDRSARGDDFCGSHGGGERSEHMRAGERHGNVAEGKNGMAAGEYFAVVHGGDGAAGGDGEVAAN